MTATQVPDYRLQRQFSDENERERYNQYYEKAGVTVSRTLLRKGLCVATLKAERIPR
tara:strand:+ start:225 stop:395 length:171 start_codon:yes stop_codon:yes gene_type:complete